MWSCDSEIYLAQSTAPMLQLLAVRPLARQAHMQARPWKQRDYTASA